MHHPCVLDISTSKQVLLSKYALQGFLPVLARAYQHLRIDSCVTLIGLQVHKQCVVMNSKELMTCRTGLEYNGNYAAELTFDDGDTYVLSMVRRFSGYCSMYAKQLIVAM